MAGYAHFYAKYKISYVFHYILTEDNADAFIELLEKYDAEYYAGSIESTSADAEVLAEAEE